VADTLQTAADPVAALPRSPSWPPGVPARVTVPEENLWNAFARRVQAQPQEVALQFLGRAFTWAELGEQVDRLTVLLQGLGVQRGDRVVLFSQNGPAFIVAFHAVLRLGAAAMPINPMNRADELRHPLNDAGARVAIASSDMAGELARAAPDARQLRHLIVFDLADFLPESDGNDPAVRAHGSGGLPSAWQTWLGTRHAPPSADGLSVHPWPQGPSGALSPVSVNPVETATDDLALLSYTSGTTGLPKGCMHSHRSLMHNVVALSPWIDLRAGDRMLIVVPMFHITGLVNLLSAIHHGASVVLLPRWDKGVAAQAIAEHRVTHWPNIPTMVVDLLSGADLSGVDLSSLRYIGGGGAPMPEAVGQQLQSQFGLDYLEGYGLTETAAPTHQNPRNEPRRRSLGIPFIGTDARIVDSLTLQAVPAGEDGEIVVRGPQLFVGYWGLPQATADAFIEVEGLRYFRTGDIGRMDEQGFFVMTDRLKRMINASGFKVWPAEVEALLHSHPAVKESCVIAMRDPYRGESVKALIVLREAYRGQITPETLIAWSREHMSAYKVPRVIELVDDLPRTATGKVLWRKAQEMQDGAEESA
jgi:fatty-acyl-CoA synthase